MKKFSSAFINSGFTGKFVAVILVLFCIILACIVITVAALLIASPGKAKPICDENAMLLKGVFQKRCIQRLMVHIWG